MLYQQPVRGEQWRYNSKLQSQWRLPADRRQIRHRLALGIADLDIICLDVGVGLDCLRGHSRWSSAEYFGRR